MATPSAGPAADPSAPGPDIVAGPVVDLGTTDDLGALAIAHPLEVSLATIRLWRFATDGSPARVDLDPARRRVGGHDTSTCSAIAESDMDAGPSSSAGSRACIASTCSSNPATPSAR